MHRFTVLVDAGYFLRQAAEILSGKAPKTKRADIKIVDPKGLIDMLVAQASKALKNQNLLRVYWYDGVKTTMTAEHQAIMAVEDVQFRAGTVNGKGQQKGIDSRIVMDLFELASNHAICDAMLVTGDGDLAIGIELAQRKGVRVAVLGVEDMTIGVHHSQSGEVTNIADRLVRIGKSEIAPFIQYAPAPAPAAPGVPATPTTPAAPSTPATPAAAPPVASTPTASAAAASPVESTGAAPSGGTTPTAPAAASNPSSYKTRAPATDGASSSLSSARGQNGPAQTSAQTVMAAALSKAMVPAKPSTSKVTQSQPAGADQAQTQAITALTPRTPTGGGAAPQAKPVAPAKLDAQIETSIEAAVVAYIKAQTPPFSNAVVSSTGSIDNTADRGLLYAVMMALGGKRLKNEYRNFAREVFRKHAAGFPQTT